MSQMMRHPTASAALNGYQFLTGEQCSPSHLLLTPTSLFIFFDYAHFLLKNSTRSSLTLVQLLVLRLDKSLKQTQNIDL